MPVAPFRVALGFTHVDPFEDTESWAGWVSFLATVLFHPRRSVRGY